MPSIRLGVIGIGNMGSEHCRSILAGETVGIDLVAVADRDTDRRLWAQSRLPQAVVVFEEGDALVDSGLCDAVLIAVPHYQHPALAVRAFGRGLHVLCEKPVAVYTKQVHAMVEAAGQSGKTFALMFNQRTNCLYRAMHDLIVGGELGEIQRVNWIITDWFRTQHYYDSGAWRATWEGEGGGVLLNQCPHNLDLLQWICGMPATVQAFCREGQWHDIEVEDDVTAYLTYPNGATGVFVTTTGEAPGTNRLEVACQGGKLVCEHGTLTLHRNGISAREYCVTATDNYSKPDCTVAEVPTDGLHPQHVGVLNAFAAHILRGEPLVAEGAEGIRSLTLSNAMHLSSWLGRAVTLPLDEDLFEAELNKRRATSRVKCGQTKYHEGKGNYGS